MIHEARYNLLLILQYFIISVEVTLQTSQRLRKSILHTDIIVSMCFEVNDCPAAGMILYLLTLCLISFTLCWLFIHSLFGLLATVTVRDAHISMN